MTRTARHSARWRGEFSYQRIFVREVTAIVLGKHQPVVNPYVKHPARSFKQRR